jgi:tRNA:m4X modification enzyme
MFPYHKYLQDYGIAENDFKRICAMSSWAVCGQRLLYENENSDDEDNEGNHAYNEAEDDKENNKYARTIFFLHYKLRSRFDG